MRARGPVGFTCPKIDSVISGIDDVIKAAKALHDFVGRHGTLEEIRSANDALRDWGAEQEDKAEELAAEVDKLQDKLSDAESMLADANKRITELEKELSLMERA